MMYVNVFTDDGEEFVLFEYDAYTPFASLEAARSAANVQTYPQSWAHPTDVTQYMLVPVSNAELELRAVNVELNGWGIAACLGIYRHEREVGTVTLTRTLQDTWRLEVKLDFQSRVWIGLDTSQAIRLMQLRDRLIEAGHTYM